MEVLQEIVGVLEYYVWSFGIPVGNETIPLVVIFLVGAGLYLTFRTGFVQFKHLGHGFAVTSGKYDDPDEPGDVPHFQALTTALSATVGIGNIAGVAIAIHFGGPGALFWMWVTALLGMATKFSEVTLAQYYRDVEPGGGRMRGTVSGGPMYYIEKGLGKSWKPLAVLFAFLLMCVSFLTGNGIQANTVADVASTEFGIAAWAMGLITSAIVALVILGGIRRIGRVTSILAPGMAAVYVAGALLILAFNYDAVLPTIARVFTEAFSPSAGVAGTGTGAFLLTMMWGVRRGLFSNEAGMGSAPIAHSAAQTDEPVSEGVVALLEPFIDTIIICSLTGLVILTTGAWEQKVPSTFDLGSGDVTYVREGEGGLFAASSAPERYPIQNGTPEMGPEAVRFAWHDVPVDTFYTDPQQTQLFSGYIDPQEGVAYSEGGETQTTLYGDAVENSAPLTQLAFKQGLAPLGNWGGYIVSLSVLLFAISTAISWSYYGNRCANYLFGPAAILPYNIVYVIMHFIGAILSLAVVWTIGDVFLGMVILPNLLAVILLSGKLREIVNSYFRRKPWRENEEVQRRIREERRREEAERRGESV